MAPPLLFDITKIDLDQVLVDTAGIEKVNPHRGDMRMLDAIINFDRDRSAVLAYKDARQDEFWVPGHIPGRPLFPGVLMIEAGAHLASWLIHQIFDDYPFLGFVGCDEVKFRGQVVPGNRLYLLGISTSFKRRRSICSLQGVVNGNLVFEAKITGMPV